MKEASNLAGLFHFVDVLKQLSAGLGNPQA
jgi:hypothetical protein